MSTIDGVPNDGVPVIIVDSVQIWAFGIAVILSVGGTVWALVCFIFVWIHREAKYVLITINDPSFN